MGNKKSNRRSNARRAATFMAAIGMLVLSSGIALMATSTSANAAPSPKIVVCKYVSTPGGQLQGGNNPIEVSLNSLNHVVDPAWIANPTFPKSWGDAQGKGGGSIAIGYAGQGLDISDCPGSETPPEDTPTTAGVDFTDPTCDVAASYTPTGGEGVDYAVTSGSVAAGSDVTITATAQAGFVINGQTVFTHSFPAVGDCGSVTPPVVSPPVVNPPKHHTTTKTKSHTTVTTPTVVHAGLASATTNDLRSEQGLALVVAGMVMLLGAGGLGLRSRVGVRI